MRGWLAVAALLVWGCGGTSWISQEPLPDLPTIKLEAFQPTIRAEVEKALVAAESSPEDAAAVGELAMVLHAHQQNSSAETCYERCRILEPEKFDWVYLLAAVQSEQGKNQQAIANLRTAIEIDGAYVPAKLMLADLLLKTSQADDAERLFREAIADDPQSAIAWYGLGRVQTTNGQGAAAVDAYENAVELYPNYGQAHYALALALRRLKRTDESKEHFQLGEQHKLETPPTGDRVLAIVRGRTKSPTEFLRAGVELDKQGRVDESIAAHLEVLKIDPEQAQAHINLISLYGRKGQSGQALKHYKAAMEINGNLPDCHYNYGVLLYSLQKFDEAKTAFRKAVEINPFYARAHHNLGAMLEAEGKLDQAVDEYRAAIENQPDYRMAHFSLGRLLAGKGDLDGAIRHFSQTIEPVDHETAGYLYALGIAYARKRDRPAALRFMRQAKDQASAQNQWQLLAAIQKDLETLEGRSAQR